MSCREPGNLQNRCEFGPGSGSRRICSPKPLPTDRADGFIERAAGRQRNLTAQQIASPFVVLLGVRILVGCGKHSHQRNMGRFGERIDRHHGARMGQCPLRRIGQTHDQRFQHAAAQSAEALALGHTPMMESKAAGQLEALQELAPQCHRRLLEGINRQLIDLAAVAQQRRDTDDVDLAVLPLEGYPRPIGLKALNLLVVDHVPQFRQTPAQRSPRVVGAVPQQVAQ